MRSSKKCQDPFPVFQKTAHVPLYHCPTHRVLVPWEKPQTHSWNVLLPMALSPQGQCPFFPRPQEKSLPQHPRASSVLTTVVGTSLKVKGTPSPHMQACGGGIISPCVQVCEEHCPPPCRSGGNTITPHVYGGHDHHTRRSWRGKP